MTGSDAPGTKHSAGHGLGLDARFATEVVRSTHQRESALRMRRVGGSQAGTDGSVWVYHTTVIGISR